MKLKAVHLTHPQDGLGDFLLAQVMQPSQIACKERSGAWFKLDHGATGAAPMSLYRLSAMVFGLCMTGIARGSRCCWLANQATLTATEWSLNLHKRP